MPEPDREISLPPSESLPPMNPTSFTNGTSPILSVDTQSASSKRSASDSGITTSDMPPIKKKAVSRSATSKATLNKSVIEGTFVRNLAKWANYKDKLKVLDANYSVDDHDPKRTCYVRHSVCAENILMSAPYDISRFKEHIKHCTVKKSITAASNTRSLLSFFQPKAQSQLTAQAQASSVIAVKLWPCPGLTQADDVRITQYLQRTVSASAGGASEHLISNEIYGKEYSSLSPSQKRVVDLRQVQTHRWKLDHLRSRITAIGSNPCAENVRASTTLDIDSLSPCEPCRALLSLREFQTAIQKPLPANQNHVFVPHRHQNSAIGQIYAKNIGLEDLLSEVWLICSLYMNYSKSSSIAGNYRECFPVLCKKNLHKASLRMKWPSLVL